MSLVKMNLKVVIKLALVVSTTFAAPTKENSESSEKLLELLPLCKRSDPKIDECFRKATESLRARVAEGIPELNLPGLEPLKVPSIRLEQTTDMLSYKAVLMDVVIHGLSNYNFTEIKTDMENLTISGTANFSHVYLDSEYMVMGHFQMLPVEGSGRLMANFTDNTATIKLQGALVKRHNEFYYMNHNTEVSVQVGDVQANFENIYTGNSEKSMISKHILEMHTEEIVEELKPAVETVVSMLLDDVASKFFKSLPFDKLFPE